MPHRHHRSAHAEPHVMSLALDDLEWVEDGCVGSKWSKASTRPARFPPAISDAELARLVDECAAELCKPGFFDAYVY